jgi:UPF0176 protein
MAQFRNLVSHHELKRRLASDPRPRTTLSFYRYTPLGEVAVLRDTMYGALSHLEVLGRIYLATEGINAQVSVPSAKLNALQSYLESIPGLSGMRLNVAVQDNGRSFWVLKVKVRSKIVADGIEDPDFSMQQTGQRLEAAEFNAMCAREDAVVVDMRNYYEYEVGHFEGAREVSSDTFREQLPMAVKQLAADKQKQIVLYCTGGIRCEKAGAYLLHHGFANVYHLDGGIIEYLRQVKQDGLENKFRGTNIVFDDRLGERIGNDVISQCHQCRAASDSHRNCAYDACHLLFIQCEACNHAFEGCCGLHCQQALHAANELAAGTFTDLAARAEGAVLPFNNSRQRMRARFFDVREKQRPT